MNTSTTKLNLQQKTFRVDFDKEKPQFEVCSPVSSALSQQESLANTLSGPTAYKFKEAQVQNEDLNETTYQSDSQYSEK